MPYSVRQAARSDAGRIAELNRRLAEETEHKQLYAATVVDGVTAVIDNAAHGRYYVADSGTEVVGQLLITYEWSDWRNGLFWWIQSVYVSPEHRRQGVFTALFEHVSELARSDTAVRGLRLYVEQDNAPALATYRALGLSDSGYRVLEIELN